MRNLSAIWRRALSCHGTRRVVLVTLQVGRHIRPTRLHRHLAVEPNTIRAATDLALVTDDQTGRVIPFWPTAAVWPTMSRGIDLHDRRAEIPTTSVSIMDSARISDVIPSGEHRLTGWARVDLWSDLVPLRDALECISGPFTAEPDGLTGGYRIDISDGDPNRHAMYPPGLITGEEFPESPDWVRGTFSRQIIHGPFPEDVVCTQIDQDGRVFYLCEGNPPLAAFPTRFSKDGVPIVGATPSVEIRTTARTGIPYAAVVFAQPVTALAEGVSSIISASGGIGRTEGNPIIALLDQAGYDVDQPSRIELNHGFGGQPLPFAALFNQSADVWSIVRDRLLPQTPFAGTFRGGAFHAIRMNGDQAQSNLSVGGGLQYRIGGVELTPEDRVFNRFEVAVGRNGFALRSGAASSRLLTVRRDRNTGPSDIRSLCAASEAEYGPRELPVVEAADLAVLGLDQWDNPEPLRSPAAEELADLMVRLHAFRHQRYTYMAQWLEGMAMEENDRVVLTDTVTEPDRPVNGVATRVAAIDITVNGPVVTLQTEDATT